MGMFDALEAQLTTLIHTLPLEVFVFIASFIEEVIAPIPSLTVMVLSGSFAAIQDYSLAALFMLAIFGALGKTIGAVIVYFIADRLEDVIVARFGKFFGITSLEIESFGKKLTGEMRDYLILTGIRAFPFIPSSVVSVGCGLLKIPRRLFIVTTFLGTIIRDGIYLYFGYAGTAALGYFIQISDHMESWITLIAILGFLALCLLYYRRAQARKSS